MTTAPTRHDDEPLRRACRDLGLDDGVADALLARLLAPASIPDRDRFDQMARREAELMLLLKSDKPEKLVHDLRNVLNEVALLKAAADL